MGVSKQLRPLNMGHATGHEHSCTDSFARQAIVQLKGACNDTACSRHSHDRRPVLLEEPQLLQVADDIPQVLVGARPAGHTQGIMLSGTKHHRPLLPLPGMPWHLVSHAMYLCMGMKGWQARESAHSCMRRIPPLLARAHSSPLTCRLPLRAWAHSDKCAQAQDASGNCQWFSVASTTPYQCRKPATSGVMSVLVHVPSPNCV